MMRFFRKIRKSLVHSENARKYILYAIGEIALVVIGILIAVQINNWNELQKGNKKELELLKGLKDEISSNIEQLSNAMKIHKESKEMCVSLLLDYSKSNRIIRHSILDSLVEGVSVPFTINLKRGIIKSIIATGDLKYLQNDSLVEFVTVFEDKTAETNGDFDRLTRIYEEQLWPREHLHVRRLNRAPNLKEFFGYEIPESQYQSDYDAFFNDKVLENIYMLTLYEQTDLIDGEELLMTYLKNTLELVNKEILAK